MARFSKPELDQQADTLNAQILAALSESGIKAELNEHTGGIKIPEYFYDIANVVEKYSGEGFSRRRSGKLEVEFRSIHLGRGTLCYAKRLKTDAKDLVKKVVESILERKTTIVAHHKREMAEERARNSHAKVLKVMRDNYPEFAGNIEQHSSKINLAFDGLDENKARLILMTLRNAGISGDD